MGQRVGAGSEHDDNHAQISAELGLQDRPSVAIFTRHPYNFNQENIMSVSSVPNLYVTGQFNLNRRVT